MILATHPWSALGSSTVTITTGAPLPIATLGRLGAFESMLLPPVRPNTQKTARKASMPITINRSLSRRKRFFSAGGNWNPVCCRAAYGGGRDVFRGGMAKCIVWVERVERPGRGHFWRWDWHLWYRGMAVGTRMGCRCGPLPNACCGQLGGQSKRVNSGQVLGRRQ